MKKKHKILTKKFLIIEYITKRKSMKQIANEHNISSSHAVGYWIKKYKITIRKSLGMTLKSYYCKNCNKKICFHTALYGSGKCKPCAMREAMKRIHPLKYHNQDNYILVRVYDYPTGQKYVMEHRLVMEKHIGRYLTKKEIVHHINGIKDDNRIENLALTNSKNHERHTLEKLLQKRIRELESQLNEK